MAGKGDSRRPSSITFKKYDLNFMLAVGRMTKQEYTEKMKELKKDKKTRV